MKQLKMNLVIFVLSILVPFTKIYPLKQFNPKDMNLSRWYDDEESLRTYLLSWPRSGNTWMRYCLEYLTKRPTLEKQKNVILQYNCPLGYWLDMGTDYSKSPIWKMHTIDWFTNKFKSYDPENETLIFLLRNPKEVITRHMKKALSVGMLRKHIHLVDCYFGDIEIYDGWNPEKRLLIYYEDFVTNPEETLKIVLDFLGENDSYLSEFIEQYDFHKKESLRIYQTQGESVTQGKNIIHHSNAISITERKAIDTYIAQTYPVLWEKYLKRYAEK